MIKLILTSEACPEQYDAYLGDRQVGYLRLRHGYFSVECPDVGGVKVYSASPAGNGRFDSDERDYYLRFAVDAIERWVETGHVAMLPAPNVQYTLVNAAQ